MRPVRRALTAVLAALLGCAPTPDSKGPSASDGTAPLASRLSDREFLESALAPLGMPDVRDLKLVAHCPPGSGYRPAPAWPATEPVTIGWLLDSSPTEVELLQPSGVIYVFGGGPPDAPASPARWISKRHRVDSVRGFWTDADFAEACTLGLFDAPASFEEFGGGFNYCVLALWSFEKDLPGLAEKWLERFRSWIAGAAANRGSEPLSWRDELCNALIDWARFNSNAAAIRGCARRALLGYWESFSCLPSETAAREAAAQAEDYRSLLADEAAFVSHSPEGLAAMSPAGRAEYWVSLLRDLGPEEFENSLGLAYILDEATSVSPAEFLAARGSPLNAAEQLLALGEAAVPALAAHEGDRRPSRCPRPEHPMSISWGLLQCGELCEMIRNAIETRAARKRPADSDSR